MDKILHADFRTIYSSSLGRCQMIPTRIDEKERKEQQKTHDRSREWGDRRLFQTKLCP